MVDVNDRVSVSSYGNYSQNYGTHTVEITIGRLQLMFSYSTIVAFRTPETGMVVSENCFSQTTGRHLNCIDGGRKEHRVDREEFENKLREILKNYDLI